MRYLCLVYHEQARLDALPKHEYAGILGEVRDYDAELSKSGYIIASSLLQSVETATIIQVRNGTITLNDGPFSSTTKQLGGFYLIDARDLNDAIRVAAKMPLARLGCVEVRPLNER